MDMIELLLPCGFDTLEYSWVKATIGICTLVDYFVAKKHQQTPRVLGTSCCVLLLQVLCRMKKWLCGVK
jgi:hypothetical protein